MVRLGIISDSHERGLWLERFLARAQREKYDAVFHLGDVCEDAQWLERRLETPFYSVAGNCDYLSWRPRALTAEYEGHRLLAVHGDMQGVKGGLATLARFAVDNGADIALFGHTHRPCAAYEGRILCVNPGALRDGRFAELTLDGGRMIPYLKNLNDEK